MHWEHAVKRREMPIYLDYNATTPLDRRVLDAMLPYFREQFGNPASSSHAFGWTANAAVEVAREHLAAAIGATPEEIVFTSGATESNNMALRGIVGPGRHLIVSATEHKAVLDTAEVLRRSGIAVTMLPVDATGRVAPAVLRDALRPETALVSIMLANNETGTLNPVQALAAVAHDDGVPVHTDATQALGKIPLDVNALDVDFMSLSAHKCYGPKGVGLLYVRRRPRRARLEPLLYGGGHERGMRSGTLNVPGIVGFGRAAEIAQQCLAEERATTTARRDRLWARLRQGIPQAVLNGHPTLRLPNTLNCSFPGVTASDLLAALPDMAAAAGSACTSAHPEPSHVLKAMGLSEQRIRGAIRLSLGRFTTDAEIDHAANAIIAAVGVLALSPV